MKFALVSYILPPSSTGQAMLLYRLLGGLRADDYCLISMEKDDLKGNYSGRLPVNYYYLPSEFQFTRGYRFGLAAVRRYVNLLLSVTAGAYTRARRIAEVVRSEGCEAVVGCSAGHDMVYLPAAYLASRLARVPLYVYMIDDYSSQWDSKFVRFLARHIEPRALKAAAGVITISEFLRDTLRRRHGVEATVIHTPCDLSAYEETSAPARRDGETRIVFTGAVSEAQLDALVNLAGALNLLARPDTRLHLYTAQVASDWEPRGLRGPVVFHPHQSIFDIPRIQMDADLLFLPLAFDSPYPEHIRTAVPSKTGEYLASGRPILVHAPRDTFIVWYFRQHDCGLVVDENDPALLAQAVERLLTDETLRRRLVANARRCAREDFSVGAARARFARVLDVELSPQPREKYAGGETEPSASSSGVLS